MMEPYFKTWHYLSSVPQLRTVLLNSDLVAKLVDLYVINDPLSSNASRMRNNELELDTHLSGINNLNQDANFSSLIHAISYLIIGEIVDKRTLEKSVRFDACYGGKLCFSWSIFLMNIRWL